MRYAREDLEAARALANDASVAPRQACFLAQQAAEKSLKAILVFLGVDPPRVHDLDALRNMLPPDWSVTVAFPDLFELTQWLAISRYPGDWPDAAESDARKAIGEAAALHSQVFEDLRERGLDLSD